MEKQKIIKLKYGYKIESEINLFIKLIDAVKVQKPDNLTTFSRTKLTTSKLLFF
jgi:hypothetical protein